MADRVVVPSNKSPLVDLDTLFPSNGVWVGLDPSRTSSGLVVVRNGLIESYCLYPEERREGVMAGVLDKEDLKNDLESVLKGMEIDLMVVEKVFFGGYVSSFIQLVEIMNMVEELILEGRLQVKRLIRVQNTTWKSWLRPYRDEHHKELNGSQGKSIVNHCLERMGILHLIEDGKGWQDRVDAWGMLVGFRVMETQTGSNQGIKVPSTVKLSPQDMEVLLVGEKEWEEEWKLQAEDPLNTTVEFATLSRYTSATMLKQLGKGNGNMVWVSPKPVVLGFEQIHLKNLVQREGLENGKTYVVIRNLSNQGGVPKTYDEWIR